MINTKVNYTRTQYITLHKIQTFLVEVNIFKEFSIFILIDILNFFPLSKRRTEYISAFQ